MSLTTYDELVAAIGRWLARGDLASQAPDLLRLAEIRLQREIQPRFSEDIQVGNLVALDGTLAQPDDALLSRLLILYPTSGDSHTLKLKEPTALLRLRRSSGAGLPYYYTHIGLNFWLAPVPDMNYAYDLVYQKQIPPLGGTNQTNWWTENAPDLLLYGALVEASPYIKDDQRIQVWQGFYDRGMGTLRAQEWTARIGGGAMTIQTESWA